jgi:putative ubiquitin-RnfH superfamily antitoxin RatB of RatAB toxin-antitoxin module
VKRCLVAYAAPGGEHLWPVELPDEASIGEALEAARALAGAAAIPWQELSVGVFGELRRRSDPCADGDRIELYRPLKDDPRARRRARVRQGRR